MRALKKWLTKAQPKRDAEDITQLAKTIGPIIDQAANDIFRHFADALMTRPVGYIVSAVWGSDDYGQMDAVSTGIQRVIVPAMHNAFTALNLEKASLSQEFAIAYLIRGLIISKIAFMIESTKNMAEAVEHPGERSETELRYIEPLGTA